MVENLNESCSICTNSNCILFNLEIDKARINDSKLEVDYKNHELIFRENKPSNGVYIVKTGFVKITKSISGDHKQIISLKKPGELFGNLSNKVILKNQNSAYAVSEAKLCYFPQQVFRDLINNSIKINNELLNLLNEEFQNFQNKVYVNNKFSVKNRVAYSLIFFETYFGQTNGFLNVILSRKEVAEFSNTSEEQVIRTLSSLKKDGLISVQNKSIGILDRIKLNNLMLESC